MASVPANTGAITPGWLTEVLRASGRLKGSVESLEREPIGEGIGLMGELARLHLTYSSSEDLPPTMVAKCAAQNENKEVARLLDFYNREADFYNRIAPDCPLTIPSSYYADVNQDSYDFVLLMEDLGDVAPPDQLVGASEEETYSAVSNIAKQHAKWWGATLESHPWMFDMMSATESERIREVIYMPALEPAIEKFSYLLDEESKRILHAVGENYADYWARNMTQIDTFVHGDYRQDNMLYLADRDDALVMDWQISGLGKPVFDVAYFMCQSLDSDLRSGIERDVLAHYVNQLSKSGVDYDFESCFEDYRRIILGCLVYPVTVCGTLDTGNERGKALGETIFTRNLAAISDLGSADLLKA